VALWYRLHQYNNTQDILNVGVIAFKNTNIIAVFFLVKTFIDAQISSQMYSHNVGSNFDTNNVNHFLLSTTVALHRES